MMVSRRVASLSCGIAIGVCSLTAAPSMAQEAPSIFGSIFGFQSAAPDINYSERAPLVIPKKKELITPGDATLVEADPNWPVDPDVVKRRKREAEKKMGFMPTKDENFFPRQNVGQPLNVTPPKSRERMIGELVHPDDLRKSFRTARSTEDAPALVPGQEPKRRSLIEPPPGMRVPVASAGLTGDEPLPSEQVEKKKKWYELLGN